MKTTYIDSSGVRLLVKIEEPNTEEQNPQTLIFVHGYPDTHSTWSKQIDAFKDQYRIIFFDLRGCGSSSPPKDRTGYHIDYLMADLDAIIKELANGQKVHLIGHDWGAIICWCFLAIPSYAQKIQSFTAISGPHPTLTTKNIIDNLKSLDPFSFFAAVRQLMHSWYIALFQIPRFAEFLIFSSPEAIWKSLTSNVGLDEEDEMRHKNREEILSSSIGPINLYRELVQGGLPPLPEQPIEVPVTVIIPKKDLAITDLAYDNHERIVKHIDMRKIDANHWVHRERPDEINRLISIFLKRVQSRTTKG